MTRMTTPTYDLIGRSYEQHRRPDPRIVARILAALGDAGLARLGEDVVRATTERLATDLVSGAWERRYGHRRGLEEVDLGYRLVVSPPP